VFIEDSKYVFIRPMNDVPGANLDDSGVCMEYGAASTQLSKICLTPIGSFSLHITTEPTSVDSSS
jgi:hypothetical protein